MQRPEKHRIRSAFDRAAASRRDLHLLPRLEARELDRGHIGAPFEALFADQAEQLLPRLCDGAHVLCHKAVQAFGTAGRHNHFGAQLVQRGSGCPADAGGRTHQPDDLALPVLYLRIQ